MRDLTEIYESLCTVTSSNYIFWQFRYSNFLIDDILIILPYWYIFTMSVVKDSLQSEYLHIASIFSWRDLWNVSEYTICIHKISMVSIYFKITSYPCISDCSAYLFIHRQQPKWKFAPSLPDRLRMLACQQHVAGAWAQFVGRTLFSSSPSWVSCSVSASDGKHGFFHSGWLK